MPNDIVVTISEDSQVLSNNDQNTYQVTIYEDKFTVVPYIPGTLFQATAYVTHSDTSGFATLAGTASLAYTASYLTGTIESASYAVSSSYAISSSFARNSISSSYALSGSYSRSALSSSYSSFALSSSYSGNAQIYSSSFASRITTDETNISNLQTDSGSFSTRITNQENFSSSLDLTYATDAELNAATASLSSSLAIDIATNVSDISNLQTDSGSFSTRVTDLETQTVFSGSFSGSFEGNGSGITGIISSSYAVSASYSANVPVTASYALTALSSSYAVSSSYARSVTSASFATTASYINITDLPIYWEYDDVLYNKQGFSGSIQLRPTNIPTDFLTGGTAIADYYSTKVPSRAVDNNYADQSGATENYWTAGVGTLPKSWIYDLGAGVQKTFTKLRIIPLPESTGSGNHWAKDFTVSGSNDGSSWTLLGTYSIPDSVGDGGWHTFTASNATPYRYYQFGFQNNYKVSGALGFEDISIVEIEMYEPTTAGIVGITGSLQVTSGITGSLFGTSSWANNATSASYAPTISGSYSYANLDGIPVGILSSSEQIASDISGSFTAFSSSAETRITDLETFSSSLDIVSSSYAISSSYALSASYAPSIPSGTYSYDNLDNIPVGIVSGAEQINTGSFSGSFYGDGSNLNDIQLAQTASYFQTSSITPSASYAEFALTASYALNGGSGTGSVSADTVWTASDGNVYNTVTSSLKFITHPTLEYSPGTPTASTIDPIEYSSDATARAAYSSSVGTGSLGSFIGSGSNFTVTAETASTAINYYSSFTADKMFDNVASAAQRWASGYPYSGNYNLWVKHNIGSTGGTRRADKLRIMFVTQNSGTWGKWVQISGSNDDVNWTPITTGSILVQNYTTDYANVWEVCNLQSSAAYQYFMFNFTGSYSAEGYISVMEAELYEFTSSADTTSSLMIYSDDTLKTSGSYSLKAITDQNALNTTATHILTASLDLSGENSIQFDTRASRTGSQYELRMHNVGGAINSHSINIATSGSWQHETWDISQIAGANKNAIASMSLKVTNADFDNNFNIDSIWAYTSGSATLTIIPGKLEVSGSFYMTSPDGNVWKLTLGNSGTLTASLAV